jgi:membrane dipeptidase
MKENNKKLIVAILVVFGYGMISCSSQQTEADFATRVKELHDKVLTVDTHSDTPSRLLSEDWDIGERHESTGRRGSKIDIWRPRSVLFACSMLSTRCVRTIQRSWL